MTFEEMKQITEMATSHDWFDYVTLICSVVVPAIAAGLSYVFFKRHASQVLNEKLIEREVEALYDVMDCFFSFSDAFSLYHSLSYKKFRNDLQLVPMVSDISEQVKTASDTVLLEHRSIKRGIFLLEAQGEDGAAKALDNYHQAAVEIRKRLYFAEEEQNLNEAARLKNEVVLNYDVDVKNIKSLRANALTELASSKMNLSSKYSR
jgi:predicted polyphosphate/ATP-dependent NAD kinase